MERTEFQEFFDQNLANYNPLLFLLNPGVLPSIDCESYSTVTPFLNLVKEQEPYRLVPENERLSLDKIYIYRKKEEVLNYLGTNNYFENLLIEAFTKIEDFFPQSKLFLEVVCDPEEENSEHLVLFIKTSLTPVEAINRLNQLDEQWWIDASSKTECTLSINLEF